MPPLPAIGPLASALGVGVACSPGLSSRAIGVTAKTPLNQPWSSVVSGQRTTVSASAAPSSASASSTLLQQSVFSSPNDDTLNGTLAPLVNEKRSSLSSCSTHQNYTSCSNVNEINPLKRNVADTSSYSLPTSLHKNEGMSGLPSTPKDPSSTTVRNLFSSQHIPNKVWSKPGDHLPSVSRFQSRDMDSTSLEAKCESRFQLKNASSTLVLNMNNTPETNFSSQSGVVPSAKLDSGSGLSASGVPYNIKSEFRNVFSTPGDSLTTQFQRRWADEMSDKDEDDEEAHDSATNKVVSRRNHSRGISRKTDENTKTLNSVDSRNVLSWRSSGNNQKNIRCTGSVGSGGFNDNKNIQIQRCHRNRKMPFENKKEIFNSCNETFTNRNDSSGNRNRSFKNQDAFGNRHDCFGQRQDLFRKRNDSFEGRHELLGNRSDSYGSRDEHLRNRNELQGRRAIPVGGTDRDIFARQRFNEKTSTDAKLESESNKIKGTDCSISNADATKSGPLYEANTNIESTQKHSVVHVYSPTADGIHSLAGYSEAPMSDMVLRGSRSKYQGKINLEGTNDDRCSFSSKVGNKNVEKLPNVSESEKYTFNAAFARENTAFSTRSNQEKSALYRGSVKNGTEVQHDRLDAKSPHRGENSAAYQDRVSYRQSSNDMSNQKIRVVGNNPQSSEPSPSIERNVRMHFDGFPDKNIGKDESTSSCATGTVKQCQEKSADACVQNGHVLSYQRLVFSDHQPVPFNGPSTYISSIATPYGRQPVPFSQPGYPTYQHNVSSAWQPKRGSTAVDLSGIHGGNQGRSPVSSIPSICSEKPASLVETSSNGHPCFVSFFRSNAPVINPKNEPQGLTFPHKVTQRDGTQPCTVVISDERKNMSNTYQGFHTLHQRPSVLHHGHVPLVGDDGVRDRMSQEMGTDCNRNSSFYDSGVMRCESPSEDVRSKTGPYISSVPGGRNMMVMMTSSVPNTSVNGEEISSLRDSYNKRAPPPPSHVGQSYFYISQGPALQSVDVYHHSLGRAVAVNSSTTSPNRPVHLANSAPLGATPDQRVPHVIPAGYFHGISVYDTSSIEPSTRKDIHIGEKCDTSIMAPNSQSPEYVHCFDTYSGQQASRCGTMHFNELNAISTYNTADHSGLPVTPAPSVPGMAAQGHESAAMVTSHSMMSKDYYSYSLLSQPCGSFQQSDSERLQRSGHSRSHSKSSRSDNATHYAEAANLPCRNASRSRFHMSNGVVGSVTPYDNNVNARFNCIYGVGQGEHDNHNILKQNRCTHLAAKKLEVSHEMNKSDRLSPQKMTPQNDHFGLNISENLKRTDSDSYSKQSYRHSQNQVQHARAHKEPTSSFHMRENEMSREDAVFYFNNSATVSETRNGSRAAQEPEFHNTQRKLSVKNVEQCKNINNSSGIVHCEGQSQILKSALKSVTKEASAPSGEDEARAKVAVMERPGFNDSGLSFVRQDNYQKKGNIKKSTYTRRKNNIITNQKNTWERANQERGQRDVCRHFLLGRCTFANCNFLHVENREKVICKENFPQKKAHDGYLDTQFHEPVANGSITENTRTKLLENFLEGVSGQQPVIEQQDHMMQGKGESTVRSEDQTGTEREGEKPERVEKSCKTQDKTAKSPDPRNVVNERTGYREESWTVTKTGQSSWQGENKNQKSGKAGTWYLYHRHPLRGKGGVGQKINSAFSSETTAKPNDEAASRDLADRSSTEKDTSGVRKQRRSLKCHSSECVVMDGAQHKYPRDVLHVNQQTGRDEAQCKTSVMDRKERCIEDQAAQARHFISSLARTFVTENAKNSNQDVQDVPPIPVKNGSAFRGTQQVVIRGGKSDEQRRSKNYRDRSNYFAMHKTSGISSIEPTTLTEISNVPKSKIIDEVESGRKTSTRDNAGLNMVKNGPSKGKRFHQSNFRHNRGGKGVRTSQTKREQNDETDNILQVGTETQMDPSLPKEATTKHKGDRRKNRYNRPRRQRRIQDNDNVKIPQRVQLQISTSQTCNDQPGSYNDAS